MGTDLAPVVVTAMTVATELETLDDIAAWFAKRARSKATMQAYARQLEAFGKWCRARGLESWPLRGRTIARYLVDRATVGTVRAGETEPRPWSVGTLAQTVSAFSHAQREAGVDPIITPQSDRELGRVWEGIRRQLGGPPRRARPIGRALLRAMCAAQPDTTRGLRNRLAFLVGWGGAFRRSELAGLLVEDVELTDRSFVVLLRRSKTDQTGEGAYVTIGASDDPVLDVVATARAWLERTGIEDGALIRVVDQHGNLRDRGLGGRDVSRIVKSGLRRAGEDPAGFSGHSLRAGLATEALTNGLGVAQVQQQGRWKTPGMVTGVYYRVSGLENPAARLL
jgi:site-specific recombinase XerD